MDTTPGRVWEVSSGSCWSSAGRDNIAQALRDMVAGVEELSAKGSLLTRARSG